MATTRNEWTAERHTQYVTKLRKMVAEFGDSAIADEHVVASDRTVFLGLVDWTKKQKERGSGISSITSGSLASVLQMNRNTVSASLCRLRQVGLCRAERDASDRRAALYRLATKDEWANPQRHLRDGETHRPRKRFNGEVVPAPEDASTWTSSPAGQPPIPDGPSACRGAHATAMQLRDMAAWMVSSAALLERIADQMARVRDEYAAVETKMAAVQKVLQEVEKTLQVKQ